MTKWVLREVLFDEDGIPLSHREPTEEPTCEKIMESELIGLKGRLNYEI